MSDRNAKVIVGEVSDINAKMAEVRAELASLEQDKSALLGELLETLNVGKEEKHWNKKYRVNGVEYTICKRGELFFTKGGADKAAATDLDA